MDYYIQNGFVDINKLTKAEKTGVYDSHCTITERIEYLPPISPADDKEEYFSRESFEQDEEELASIMSYVCVKQKTA